MVKIDLEYSLGVLIVTSCLLTVASSCFITNCPPGGKRSISSTRTVRQCLKCGPGGLGQCFGPNICCGELIGCHIRTIESANCAKENEIPILCEVRGKECAGGRGRCGTNGVCCNEETCTLDDECSRPAGPVDDGNKKPSEESIDEELGILLQRLLHSPREGSRARQLGINQCLMLDGCRSCHSPVLLQRGPVSTRSCHSPILLQTGPATAITTIHINYDCNLALDNGSLCVGTVKN